VSERLSTSGRDVTQFARDLLAHLRQLIVIRTAGDLPDAFTVTAAEPERLRAQAQAIPEQALGRSIDVLSKALTDIREGDEPRMTVELALLRAARPQLDPSREALLERLDRLEAALTGGSAPQPNAPAARQQSAPAAAQPGSPSQAPPATEPAPPAGDGSDEAESEPPPRTAEAAADAASDSEPAPGGPPQATAVAEIDLEKLVGLWPAVLDQVRTSGSELLSHVLAAARPVAIDIEEAVVQVGFPPSAAFNKRKAEAAEARDRMAEAVKTIVGERLRPVYVLLESDEIETPEEAKLSEEELIELMRTEFDAEEYVAEPEGEAEPREEAG
jgi:DNA polymerase-3 subunit gamma/tau